MSIPRDYWFYCEKVSQNSNSEESSEDQETFSSSRCDAATGIILPATHSALCSVLQCVALCCSVLHLICHKYQPHTLVVCCSALQCAVVCCSVLRCVADRCRVVVFCSVLQCVAQCCSVLQCVAVCCSVLQCAAVCCSVLQRVAACCSVL